MGKANSKNKLDKKNTMLNIYVCNSNQQIKNIKFMEEQNDNLIQDIDYIEYRHKFYGWYFYDYRQELNNNKIKEIRDKIISEAKNKNFQNVVIYFDKNSNRNDNALRIMRSIAEIPKLKGTHSEYYQPLLLYISYSKEKNIYYYRRRLHELIKESPEKYVMDELNITSFLYNEKTFNSELINELWQMTIYFNQIPSYILPMSQNDDKFEIKFDNNIFTLNFLLAGKNGTGKSTFINILKGRKIAYQSDIGIVKTNKINEYIISIHKEIPKNGEISEDSNNNIDNNIINNTSENSLIENSLELSTENSIEKNIGKNKEISFCYQFIDTLGFSADNIEAKQLLKCIEEYNDESIKRKDRLQCILYFVNDDDKRITSSDVIKNFFKFIVQQKIKVIFVINFNDGESHDCKEKLTTVLQQDLSEDEFNFLVEDDESNIIELSLKKNKKIKPFGLNKLMLKLEKFFENNRVNTNELVELSNKLQTPMNKTNKNERREEKLKEYLEVLRRSELFKDINTVDDLYIKFISKSKKLILYSMPILAGISFIPIPGVDDAIALSIESGLIAAIGNCFGINMNKEEIKRAFINVNFGSFKRVSILVGKVVLRAAGIIVDVLKLAPPLGTIIAGAVSAGVNVTSVKLTGEQAISYFLDRFIKEIDYKYLINMCESYNNNIDGFKYLKEYIINYAEED